MVWYHDSAIVTIVSRQCDYYRDSEYIRNYRPALIGIPYLLCETKVFPHDESRGVLAIEP